MNDKESKYSYNAWEDYGDKIFKCSCGWSKKGYLAIWESDTELVSILSCPECGSRLTLISNETSNQGIAEIGLNGGTKAHTHMVLALAEKMSKKNISYPSYYDEAKYGDKYYEALLYAAKLHKDQHRKSNKIPYISHLLSVSSIVWENGGTEDMAIGGLLHDAVEDQGGLKILEDIKSKFGESVSNIVLDCSDSISEDPNKKLPWRERKEAHIKHLYEVNLNSLLVAIADKTHNGSMIVNDFYLNKTIGYDDVFTRFNAPAEDILWYYKETLEVAKRRIPYEPATIRFNDIVSKLSSIVEVLHNQ